MSGSFPYALLSFFFCRSSTYLMLANYLVKKLLPRSGVTIAEAGAASLARLRVESLRHWRICRFAQRGPGENDLRKGKGGGGGERGRRGGGERGGREGGREGWERGGGGREPKMSPWQMEPRAKTRGHRRTRWPFQRLRCKLDTYRVLQGQSYALIVRSPASLCSMPSSNTWGLKYGNNFFGLAVASNGAHQPLVKFWVPPWVSR